MIHVRQRFHAVGHGTFLTGRVFDDDAPNGDEVLFCWAYDCGSKRTTRIDREITKLDEEEGWPKAFDLLVLSHFDDDHVNGVESFLRARSVRVLALPYMDVAHRLAQAAGVGAPPCSASSALFQLDPVGWLRQRGLSDRVETIMVVRGDRGDDSDPPRGDPDAPPPEKGNESDRTEWEKGSPVDQIFRIDYEIPGRSSDPTASTHVPAIRLWHHRLASRMAQGVLEFKFFNAKQSDLFRVGAGGARVARRSGADVLRVQADVGVQMKLYDLDGTVKKAKSGWREALRKVYDRHFGKSGPSRNNISLCLLVRPRRPLSLPAILELTRTTANASDVTFSSFWRAVGPYKRDALLCLGDLRIDKATLGEMQVHFGSRWQTLCLVQVPHHGSRHSWIAGNAKAISPFGFVQCVPDESDQHPHIDVVVDLRGHLVMYADYESSVELQQHLF